MPTHYLTPQGRVEVSAVIKSRVWRFRLWRVATAMAVTMLVFNMSALGAIITPDIAQASSEEDEEEDEFTLDLSQWRDKAPTAWQHGDLNSSNSAYHEGESVPFELVLTGLSSGTDYTVRARYDFQKSSKNAYDYLTTYNRSRAPTTPGGSPVTKAIPADGSLGFSQVPGNFTLWGGTFVGTPSGPTTTGTEKYYDLTLHASGSSMTLMWSGHLASDVDWGADNGASSISGAPFHMASSRIVNGNEQSSQDRSIQPGAVLPPIGSITVNKYDDHQHALAGATFRVCPTGTTSNCTTITDGQSPDSTADGVVVFGNLQTCIVGSTGCPSGVGYDVTEQDAPSGWLKDASTNTLFLTSTNPNRSTSFVDPPAVCTLTITKTVDKQSAAPGDTLTYTLNYANTGTANCTGGGVRINDTIPTGATYVSGSNTQSVSNDGTGDGINFGYSGTKFGPNNPTGFNGSLLSWNAHVVSPGESGTVSFRVTVNSLAECGATRDITNSGAIYSDQVTQGVTSNNATTHAAAACTTTLTVIKKVTNDNGGTKTPSNFSMHINGTAGTAAFAGVDTPGVTTALNPGTFAVTEDAVVGYAASMSGSCSGTLVAGDHKTCTITNNDVQPKLTVTKVVVNDNGGTKQVSEFPLFVGDTSVFSSAQNGFNAGTYTVSETGDPGYTAAFSGDCNSQGQVTLGLSDVKSCTITNNDIFPDLKVSKTDNQATTTPGATYSYTLTYSNVGNRTAADVTVVDTLPTHLTYVSDTSGVTPAVAGQMLTWVMPGLAVDASNTFTVTVKVDGVMSFGTTNLHNVVSVSTSTPEFNKSNNSAADDTNVSTTPVLGIQKLVDPTTAQSGTNVNWTVKWSVAGNAPATDVVIVDPIPANSTFVSVADGGVYNSTTKIITWTLGTKAPGTSGEVHFVTKTASPIANNTVITNTATIDSAEADPAVSASASTTVTSAPVLTLTKIHDKTTFVNPGATVTYTVTVKNTGTDAAKNVVLTDTLPTGFTFTDTGLTTRTINVGTLDSGKDFTVSYTVTVGQNVGNGFYDNLATATSSNHPTLTAKVPIEVRVPQVLGVQTEPILKITKTVEPKSTTPGKTVTYTVTVKNTGDGTAENVRIEDFLPAGLTFSGSGAITRTWSLGNLEPGRSKTITYHVVVNQTILPGVYENLATASADNHDKVTAEAPLTVRKPRVLGAILPETNATPRDAVSLLASLAALILGLSLLGLNRRRSEPTA